MALRRVLGGIGSVVGATVTFVTAAAAGVIVHLDMPATRRLVVTQVNGVLAKQLRGEVKIEALTGLGLGGIDGARVRVKDPGGEQVLFADGVKVRIRTIALAESALFGKGDIRVPVPQVKIDHADVALDADPMGDLRLARAFLPKTPSEEEEPKAEKGRGIRIEAPDVVLRHAWAHGVMGEGAPAIDAEVNELAAHAYVDSNETRAGLDRAELVTRGVPTGADPKGNLTAKFRLPSGEDAKPIVEATFDGTVMGAPAAIAAKMDGDRVDATVDAHADSAARIGQALGELPLEDELSLHAEAHGVLPRIASTAHVAFGDATVDVDGNIVTATPENGDTTTISARVSAQRIDLSHITNGAPKSNLGFDATGNVSLGDEMHALVSVDTIPGVIAGQRVPRVTVRGRMDGDAARATARIHDTRMPTLVRVQMTPHDGDGIVEAHVETNVADLHALPEVGRAVQKGSVRVEADARLALQAKTITARAAVTGRRILAGEQSVNAVHAEARLNGTIDRPVIDAAVHAEELRAAGFDASKLDARTRIEAGKTLVLRDARVDLERRGETVAVSARTVSTADGVVRVDGAMIEGLGAPIRADLVRDARKVHVTVDAPAIDLTRVDKIGALDAGIRSGVLTIAGDVTLSRADTHGNLHAKLDRFSMKDLDNSSLDLDATIEDRSLTLDLTAALDKAGRLAVHSKRLTLDGAPTDPKAWKGAHGRVAVEGDVDMAKLSSFIPPEKSPFGELRGELVVDGAIGRDSATSPPEVRVHAHTLGLVVAGKTDPEPPIPKRPIETEVKGVAPWRSDDVDVGVDLRTDSTSGLTQAAFRVTDKKGIVVAFDAKSIVPIDEILADTSKAKEKLVRVPVSAKLVVPKRSLDAMPAILGVKNTSGTVEAQLDVDGTPIDPQAALVMHARGVRSGSGAMNQTADADARLTYDGRAADLDVKVAANKHHALDLVAHLDAKASDFVAGGVTPAWAASAKAKLADFPLESVAPLADRQIRGTVSGEATIDGLHHDAKLAAHLGFAKLSVGKAKYERAAIDVDAGGGKMTAKARLDQNDGFGELSATTGMTWGAAVAPALVADQPIDARLVAKNFRAAVAQPFVEGVMNELDGRVDADAKASISPAKKDARLEGKIALRDGRVELATIGEQLRDARATITMTPDGTIEVKDVYAKSVKGHLTADAKIKLAGMELESANANLHIPQKDAVDLAVNGQPIGQVAGDVSVDAKSTEHGKHLALAVNIPKFSIELPQAMKSGVQSLGANEKIRVGVYRDPNTLVKLPMDKEDFDKQDEKAKAEAVADGSRIDVDVKLGRVEIQRGNQARVAIGGNPKISVAGGETRITGRVHVIEGWADVQGKKFTVEKGIIAFQGEPEPNPIVTLTAAWTAQDQTRVYADFVGPVKTGKVHLRSEPARPQNELLALVLFGTADGANPTPPPAGKQPDGTQKAAMAAGGGFAAQGLTEALDDLSGIQATARIDTTESNNPRPEVEFQISPKVSVAFAHVIGTPPVTDPPDKNMAILEWHFRRNWSVESTSGDRGRQLFDLIWQKRY